MDITVDKMEWSFLASGSLVHNPPLVTSNARFANWINHSCAFDDQPSHKLLAGHGSQVWIVEMRKSPMPEDNIHGGSSGVVGRSWDWVHNCGTKEDGEIVDKMGQKCDRTIEEELVHRPPS